MCARQRVEKKYVANHTKVYHITIHKLTQASNQACTTTAQLATEFCSLDSLVEIFAVGLEVGLEVGVEVGVWVRVDLVKPVPVSLNNLIYIINKGSLQRTNLTTNQ